MILHADHSFKRNTYLLMRYHERSFMLFLHSIQLMKEKEEQKMLRVHVLTPPPPWSDRNPSPGAFKIKKGGLPYFLFLFAFNLCSM